MKKWTYFRLLDNNHKDVVVRADGPNQEEYDPNKREWVWSGIMIDYFSDDSDTYNMFEEISRDEALVVVGGAHESGQKGVGYS